MKIFTPGLLASLILLSFHSLGQVQTYTEKNQTYSKHEFKKPEKGPNYFIALPPKAPAATSLDDTTRVIVKLKGAPLAKRKTDDTRTSAENLKDEHRAFLEDLRALERKSARGRSSSTPTLILSEYSNTFNGFALITTKAMAEQLKGFKSVQSVIISKKVKAIDLTSNEVINVPQTWSQFGVKGNGIRIGIIDTGIDYNHQDLGGGFGPSFKVIGGYDFFNNDSDPLDDHGHGTHVAGIAAGNGANLQGVAPLAKLVAYKVLGSQGFGYDDMILAAIERTTDPDQNPATDDALDVVNMSLGRYADENEPYSEAVNNAVESGVIFVVAAGNSFDYFTVGTPGVAERAITVGAIDNSKATAYFSSKGPVERSFALKPDVAAPGVQINSSFLDNGYLALDGTSMASPHVAGAVALLLDENPSWSPEDCKSALMTTAIPGSSTSIWEQGAGVIKNRLWHQPQSTSENHKTLPGTLNEPLNSW
jgi:subtilisin family serine protease